MKSRLLAYDIFYNNEYFDKYVALLAMNLSTPREILKTQEHHIIPRRYYKHIKAKLDDSNDNKVNLYYKDHILAHYYLYLCCKDSYLKQSNAAAVRLMVPELPLTTDEKTFIEKLPYYAELKEKSLASITGENNPAKRADVKQKISNALIGRKFSAEQIAKMKQHKKSAEHCRKISEAAKGRKHSKESCLKRSEAMKGRLTGELNHNYGKPAYNRGIPCPEHVKKAVSEANKGKTPRLGAKLSDETKQLISFKARQRPKRTWVHNAETERMINIEDKPIYLANGYKPGRRPKHG